MLSPTPQKPTRVSVIMANYNGSAYLAEAIETVRKQSLADLELIVSDDASSDDSVAIVEAAAAADPRIRLMRSERNSGPAAARNRALAAAKGEWIAVMDSDDLMHPERLAKLVEAGERDGADIVADDVLEFDTEHGTPPRPLLTGRWASRPTWVDAKDYVRRNHFYGAGPTLGYLKPIFRSSVRAAAGVRYDESLRLAEDYHFVLELLCAGATMRLYPLLLYFYRKHGASTSHRLSEPVLQALKAADLRARDIGEARGRALLGVMRARAGSIETALYFEKLLNALKARDWRKSLAAAAERPQCLALLRQPVWARCKRLIARSRPSLSKNRRAQLCILSRQRVVGHTNGSSTYLLSLAQFIASRGIDVHFLAPSPATLGRWPYLKLSDDLGGLRSYRLRGAWRCGRYLISTDPTRYLRGALGLFDRALMKSGLTRRLLFKPDPYSIAQPLTRKDQLFIARHAPLIGDFLLADYCFLGECFPYALRPKAPTAIIMHDRFSSRSGQFDALGGKDSVALLSEEEECRLLSLADHVVAIQAEEGEWVRQRVSDRNVIVTPMAVEPVASAQPGEDDVVLFVGSSAAPNVDGLTWFLDACWPSIRRLRPDAALLVAGSVCGALGRPPEGAQFLGFVSDLGDLYKRAGVVVSPLRIGSGLKIKLIEALGKGKALVGTPKTLQGVEQPLADALVVENSAEGLAAAVARLLANRAERSRLAERALAAANRRFTAEACYFPLATTIASALAQS